MQKHNIKIKDLSGLIKVSGPGSYTGMRLAEGVSQVLDWLGVKTFSFYHFQVPSILGFNEGAWYCKAFKGETFVYLWRGKETESFLIDKDKFETLSFEQGSFSHFEGDEVAKMYTSDMIKRNPDKLFSSIIENNKKEVIHYFRPQDIEFTKPKRLPVK